MEPEEKAPRSGSRKAAIASIVLPCVATAIILSLFLFPDAIGERIVGGLFKLCLFLLGSSLFLGFIACRGRKEPGGRRTFRMGCLGMILSFVLPVLLIVTILLIVGIPAPGVP